MRDDLQAPIGDHSYPSRPDLTDALAVVARAPAFMYPPGGYRDSQGRWTESPDDTAVRFGPVVDDLARLIGETLPAALRRGESPSAPSRYVYGPLGQAGMYEAVAFVLQLAPNATSIAQTADTWLSVGEWVVRLKRWTNERMQRATAPMDRPVGRKLLDSDGLVFSPALVQSVCLWHAVTTYGPVDRGESISAYCRHFGRGSPDLPSGGELYHIVLNTAAGSIHYVLTGTLRVRDHFSTTLTGVTPLDLHNFADIITSPWAGVGEVQKLPTLRVST